MSVSEGVRVFTTDASSEKESSDNCSCARPRFSVDERATSCEERGLDISRSGSNISSSSLSEAAAIAAAQSTPSEPLVCNDDEYQQQSSLSPSLRLSVFDGCSDAPCTPTIAPIDLSASALSSMGELCDEMQPPALTELPMHRTMSSSDIFAPAREFSVLSAPLTIRNCCIAHVPSWKTLEAEDLDVDQILSGLSNQLFKVNLREDLSSRGKYVPTTVLFRIYGKDVNTLYDSSTEVKVFKKLGQRAVAPKMIAELNGGRIEEWIEGCALLVSDMGKPSVMMAAAAIMAGIHRLDLSKYIDSEPCIMKFLRLWRKNAMDIYRTMNIDHPSYLSIHRLGLPELYRESFELKGFLFPEGIAENEVTRLSFCHNDIQENNIMVTSTCMRLIDFEYSGYSYPAFDIASYFWEMTCDYCVDSYPFFHVDPTKYPLIEKRRLFIASYLSKLTKRTIKITYHEYLDPILDAVERFQLACHMLWGFWSVIRAPQAATATSFDMLHYGQRRIDAYWSQKAKLIAEKKLKVDMTE